MAGQEERPCWDEVAHSPHQWRRLDDRRPFWCPGSPVRRSLPTSGDELDQPSAWEYPRMVDGPGCTPTAETPSEFAQYEAALLRRACTDAEWQELLKGRPSLADALAARERSGGDDV